MFLLSVPTAPTGVPEGASGPFREQPQSKSKKQVYYIVEYISNFYAFLGSFEPQSDIHVKKPKSAAEVSSSAYRFRRSNRNTKALEVSTKKLENVTLSSKSALTEVRVIMSCHYMLYTMMTNEKTLTDTLSLYHIILEKIQKVNSFPELKAVVYSMFTETSDKTLFEFLCCLFYIGFTAAKDDNRLGRHADLANSVYDNQSFKLEHSEKLYHRIAACWHANVKVYHKNLCRFLAEQQGFFTEYAMIAFASSMLQNCNGRQGDYRKFENTLNQMGIKKEDVIKIGCALLVDFHQTKNNFSFTQVSRNSFTVDPTRADDYVQ